MATLSKVLVLALVLATATLGLGGQWVGAQVHHVVGGDRGWEAASDVATWSSGKIFRVGDKIWFAYSAAQGSVAELGSREEYEACDVSNPIRMYTDGLESIHLNGEGFRYFASSDPDHCKNGLRLHVEVLPFQNPGTPKVATSKGSALVLAAGPTSPSGSAQLRASLVLFALGLVFLVMGN
ncbi:hypothetical protein UlMin_018026 [Ulmus minor]